MTAPRSPAGPGRAAAIAVVALSFAWVAVFGWVALSRVAHPFELEWMGGAFVDHVCRVLDGQAIYVEPTADFVPFLYAPLFFYLSAGVALVTGEGFLPLRLVSLISTLLTLGLLFVWIRRRTGSRSGAALAAGLYAAGYFVVDTWYDTARADSLFVFLGLATLVVLDRGKSTRSAVLGGLLLVVAYLAKQTALLLAPPLAIAIAVHAPRRALWFAGTFAVAWGLSFAVLDALHDGWFSYYTWTLPRRHEYVWPIALGALWIDLRPLWPSMLLGAWLVVERARCRRWRELLADGAWAGGLLLAALSSRAHVGGAVNVLMPGLLGLAAVGALAWSEARRAGRRAGVLVPWILVAQLAILVVDFEDQDDRHRPRPIDPASYLPTDADRAAGERLVTMLREADGEVLVPFHGYLARMAGKRGGAHVMALIDVERSGEPELWDRLHVEFLESARTRNAALVLLDPLAPEEEKPIERRMARLVFPGYAVEPITWPDERTFVPVVGLDTRPVFAARRQ